MNILLTGATGFLGQRLYHKINSLPGFKLTSVVRSTIAMVDDNKIFIDQISGDTDWGSALVNKDVIIHAAARAHFIKDKATGHLEKYYLVNVDGTLTLARQAAKAGVKRFIFISSIKVNGEHTLKDQPLREENIPAPLDAYGISKWQAEQGLLKISADMGMEAVIIRPPLVYGPGVKGNFAVMIKLVKKGLPLPLGAVHNKRSLIALDNLVDLIITCIDHQKAANQIFLAGDGRDLSTTELLQGIAKAAGVPSRLIPVPASTLMFVSSLLNKKLFAQKLLGSLQVDISKAKDILGWTPPLSVEEGLARCFVDNSEQH